MPVAAIGRPSPRLVASADTTTALLYRRVSQREQAEEGVSLGAQLAESRQYTTRQGWMLGEEFEDVESGRRDDRADYQRLLLTIRGHHLAGRSVALVVAALDRLGRNVAERVRVWEEMKRLGVPIYSVREGGLVSEFTYNLLASVAQEESRKLSERVKASNLYFIDRGWHIVGRVPWGYRLRAATDEERKSGSPNKVLELHPVEAEYVREAWEMLARGDSMHAIARWAARLPDVARGGRNLRFTIIRQLLRAPVYVARLGESGQGVLDRPRARWEPLIDDETWLRAQASLEAGRKMPKQASGKFPLTGLLRCHKCGSRMGGRTNRNKTRRGEVGFYREYVCCAWSQGALKADGRCITTVPAGKVEAAVLDTVGEMLEASDRPDVRRAARRAWEVRERAVAVDDVNRRIRTLELAVAAARRRIAEAAIKLIDGALDQTAYDLVRAHLQREMEGAEAELAELRGRTRPAAMPPMDAVLSAVGGWAGALRSAQPGPVRQALAVLIARIEPARVGYGKYEARIDWTPIGHALLSAALTVEPSDNLVHVERFGHP